MEASHIFLICLCYFRCLNIGERIHFCYSEKTVVGYIWYYHEYCLILQVSTVELRLKDLIAHIVGVYMYVCVCACWLVCILHWTFHMHYFVFYSELQVLWIINFDWISFNVVCLTVLSQRQQPVHLHRHGCESNHCRSQVHKGMVCIRTSHYSSCEGHCDYSLCPAIDLIHKSVIYDLYFII